MSHLIYYRVKLVSADKPNDEGRQILVGVPEEINSTSWWDSVATIRMYMSPGDCLVREEIVQISLAPNQRRPMFDRRLILD